MHLCKTPHTQPVVDCACAKRHKNSAPTSASAPCVLRSAHVQRFLCSFRSSVGRPASVAQLCSSSKRGGWENDATLQGHRRRMRWLVGGSRYRQSYSWTGRVNGAENAAKPAPRKRERMRLNCFVGKRLFTAISHDNLHGNPYGHRHAM
jgi:hypothetical protein